MLATNTVSGTLRRYLLLKIISKAAPSREDLTSVYELTSAKILDLLGAQSICFYLVEETEVAFKHVFHSPTLWSEAPGQERVYREIAHRLLGTRLPLRSGLVGQVIAHGRPEVHNGPDGKSSGPLAALAREAGFEVRSVLTVPLRTNVVFGAIQVFNKETPEGLPAEFTDEDLEQLCEFAEYTAALIQRILDPKFQLSPEVTAKFIARFTDSRLVNSLDEIDIDERLPESVGEAIIRREGVFPFKRLTATSVAALMTNPLDYVKREAFHDATELAVEEVYVVSAPLLEAAIHATFKSRPISANETTIDLAEVTEYVENTEDLAAELGASETDNEASGPIIQLVNRMIEDAYICGASDIHVEPQEKDLLVRYRIDGVCQEKLRLPSQVAKAVTTRIKIMCNLDIAERRLPQDGRIIFKKYTRKNIDVDLRVATGPCNFGEKVVLRILDKQRSTLPLTALGFSAHNLERYRRCIQQPNGMILHCGPTGSGKSMTLYSALKEIASPEVNIQTAEDPIEYTLAGINQMQMNRQIGLTFSRALRAFLRMDPDVILVGEMRDRETADIAIEAAMTGHLLLSTVHANDAPSTVARLVDMHIEPFLISSSLVCVCSQRLMRRLCKTCRQLHEPVPREAEILEKALGWSGPIYRAAPGGCHMCGGVGYKGRIGIHEIMINNEELVAAISSGTETSQLKKIAMRHGMKTLHQDALQKVREGITSLEEALSIAPADLW
jgi:type II secretory ATPase GspE/PulE/Tfp pilus assembly ATPase PilB-like protein